MSNKTKTTKKKARVSLPRPSLKMFGNIKNWRFSLHIITMLSLVPVAVALWVAFPTFSLETDTKIYQFGALQLFKEENAETGESEIQNRVGFTQSFDLQGGATFNFEMVKPTVSPTPTPENTETVEPTPSVVTEVSPTPTEVPQTLEVADNDYEKTISIIRKRIDELNAVENQLFKYKNDDKSGAIINMSSSREEAGIIPYYLSLQGKDIQIWVDDPNYIPAEDTESFSLLEGLTPSILSREDIAFAQTVNDQKTYGNGLRLVFKNSSYDKFFSVGSQVTSRGFALVIDGQPIAFQSYAINLQQPDTAVVYMTNPFGAGERISYEAISSVINNEPLPIQVTVTTNNNTDSFVEIDLSKTKLALFIVLSIISVSSLFVYKTRGILVPILMWNSLVLSIALLKLFGQPLNLNLIWGVVIGLSVVFLFGFMSLRKFTNEKYKTEDAIKLVAKKYGDAFRNLVIVLLVIASILEIFDITIIYQLSIGIGVILLTALISIWTVYKTFINELFILPLRSDVKKS